jgi:hypothetical protein
MDAEIQEDLGIGGVDVWLTIPPFSEFLRTVRLVAADAGSRAGLDYDEVEDFRIAVDELCHLLMSSTDHEISLSFGVIGNCALARGHASPRPGAPVTTLGELSRTIVNSVSDFHEVTQRQDEVAFAVMKQARLVLVTE